MTREADGTASERTLTTTTRCLWCGCELVWTALFCRLAPKDFSGYFNCGRHREKSQ